MLSLLYRAADALRRRTLRRTDHGRLGEDLAHRYLRRARLHRRGAQLPAAVRPRRNRPGRLARRRRWSSWK